MTAPAEAADRAETADPQALPEVADCRAETQSQVMDKSDYAFAHRHQLEAKAASPLAEGLARRKVYEEKLVEFRGEASRSRK